MMLLNGIGHKMHVLVLSKLLLILCFVTACAHAEDDGNLYECNIKTTVSGTNVANSGGHPEMPHDFEIPQDYTIPPPGDKAKIKKLFDPNPHGEPPEVYAEELREAQAKMKHQPNPKLVKIKKKVQCGGVVLGDSCFRLLYRAGWLICKSDAKRLCEFHGGKLPEIPTIKEYTAIFNYVKKTWSCNLSNPNLNVITVPLGSTYQNNQVTLSDGSKGLSEWQVGYPRRTGSSMYLTVPIRPDYQENAVGLSNGGSTVSGAPLCQFKMK